MADLRQLKDRAADLAAKGRLEKAAAVYRQIIEADRKDVAIRQKLAEVLRRAGEIPEAVAAYRAVADRYARDGLLIKAIAICKTILELDPNHLETQDALAELYSQRARVGPGPGDLGARRTTMMMAAVTLPHGPGPEPEPPEPTERGVAIPLGPRQGAAPPEQEEDVPLDLATEPPSIRHEPPALPRAPVPPARPSAAPLESRAPAAGGRLTEVATPFGELLSVASAARAAGVEPDIEIDVDTGLEPPLEPVAAPPAAEAAPAAVEIDVAPEEDAGPAKDDEPLGAATPAPAAEAVPAEEPVIELTPEEEVPEPAPAPAAQPPRAAPPPAVAKPPARPAASPPAPARPPPPPPAAGPEPELELPHVPIFSDLTREAFVALTHGMVLHRVKTGTSVLREGDKGSSFFVVASGRLSVSKRDDAGERVVLAQLGEGDFFGEMALLSGAPRAATVMAEEPSEVLEFREDVLRGLAARHPHLAISLKRFYRQRLLANAMVVSPLFRPFGKGDRKLIMEKFRAREVAAGEVLIREGVPSDGLYVVLDGAVDVRKRKGSEDVPVGHLREGDLFGEMSCLRKAPATASVVCRRAGTFLRLPRTAFDELVSAYPQVLELVAELSDERSEALEAILSGHAQWTEEGLVLV